MFNSPFTENDWQRQFFNFLASAVVRSIICLFFAVNLKNDNLEKQAQALFKSWFIDYEPFDGYFPADWFIGTLEDLSSEIVCGKTPSTKRKEYYGNEIPFVTIPDMHNSVYTVKTDRALSALGANSQPKKTLPKNTVCVSCIGTAGLVSLLAEKSQTNQQINSIIPKSHIFTFYIYLLMKTKSIQINKFGQSGSTIVNLNKTQFAQLPAIIPSEYILSRFHKIVKPIFENILTNSRENLILENIRNNLLQELLSNRIDLSDIKI